MADKYLDKTGLTYFWGKLKDYFQVKLVSGTNIKTINNTSLLGNGNISVGGITTETDPTVPNWAKASSKPSYTASEVGAVPTSSIASADSSTHSDFANKGTAKAYVPDMRFIAFWNGGYDSAGASNLSRCASGAIIGSNTINNYANQLAKAETVYTGAITWNSSITTQTTNVLKRKGNMVQCEIRFSAPATRVSNQAIGTIPTGYRPLQRMYVNGVRAWAVQATAPILINTDGAIKFMNEAFAASASYVIAVTWITDDNYPS